VKDKSGNKQLSLNPGSLFVIKYPTYTCIAEYKENQPLHSLDSLSYNYLNKKTILYIKTVRLSVANDYLYRNITLEEFNKIESTEFIFRKVDMAIFMAFNEEQGKKLIAIPLFFVKSLAVPLLEYK